MKIRQLTERQKEIIQLIAEGFDTKKIAEKLNLCPSTISSHVRTIFQITSVNNRAQLTAYGIRNGIISLKK